MAILTVVTPDVNGEDPGFATAAAGGDSFPNTGKEFVHIKNANATLARTVTFDSPGTCSFNLAANAAHDQAVSIPASSQRVIGPFPPGRFNDTNGRVQMTYSSEADLTIAVLKPASA